MAFCEDCGASSGFKAATGLPRLKRCCLEVYYCDQRCQRARWTTHKLVCLHFKGNQRLSRRTISATVTIQEFRDLEYVEDVSKAYTAALEILTTHAFKGATDITKIVEYYLGTAIRNCAYCGLQTYKCGFPRDAEPVAVCSEQCWDGSLRGSGKQSIYEANSMHDKIGAPSTQAEAFAVVRQYLGNTLFRGMQGPTDLVLTYLGGPKALASRVRSTFAYVHRCFQCMQPMTDGYPEFCSEECAAAHFLKVVGHALDRPGEEGLYWDRPNSQLSASSSFPSRRKQTTMALRALQVPLELAPLLSKKRHGEDHAVLDDASLVQLRSELYERNEENRPVVNMVQFIATLRSVSQVLSLENHPAIDALAPPAQPTFAEHLGVMTWDYMQAISVAGRGASNQCVSRNCRDLDKICKHLRNPDNKYIESMRRKGVRLSMFILNRL
jgi:hypothetical protein